MARRLGDGLYIALLVSEAVGAIVLIVVAVLVVDQVAPDRYVPGLVRVTVVLHLGQMIGYTLPLALLALCCFVSAFRRIGHRRLSLLDSALAAAQPVICFVGALAASIALDDSQVAHGSSRTAGVASLLLELGGLAVGCAALATQRRSVTFRWRCVSLACLVAALPWLSFAASGAAIGSSAVKNFWAPVMVPGPGAARPGLADGFTSDSLTSTGRSQLLALSCGRSTAPAGCVAYGIASLGITSFGHSLSKPAAAWYSETGGAWTVRLFPVHLFAPPRGAAAGDPGSLLFPQISCPSASTCYAVSPISQVTGEDAGRRSVVKLPLAITRTEGQRWHLVSSSLKGSWEGNPIALSCSSARNCALETAQGLATTTDSGRSWRPAVSFIGDDTSPPPTGSLRCFRRGWCLAVARVVSEASRVPHATGTTSLVAYEGRVGGARWTRYAVLGRPGVASYQQSTQVSCPSLRRCLIVPPDSHGSDLVVLDKTGTHFVARSEPEPPPLAGRSPGSLYCESVRLCFATGGGPTPLWRTGDGGVEWKPANGVAPDVDLGAVQCSSPLDCGAVSVGESDLVFTTCVGGRSWVAAELPRLPSRRRYPVKVPESVGSY